MATYYVDEYGNVTKKGKAKKKSKDNASYFVDLDGTVTRLDDDDDIAPIKSTVKTGDIAPVKSTVTKDNRSWFQKGAFEDGYQFGDLSKTVYGSVRDLEQDLVQGVVGIGEKVVDAGAYIAGGVGNLLGADRFADRTQSFIKKDLIDEEKVAKAISGGILTRNFDVEGNSVFGDKSDSLVQSAGQLGATIGLQAVGVPWFLTTGATSFGGEVESGFNQGATYGEAGVSAAITAGAEILTEKISGGIKFGGKALDDGLTKEIARRISDKTVRTLAKLGVDVVGEGSEEVLSGIMSAIGQKLTYADDKQLNELFSSEDALESFIGGAVLGGGMTGINIGKNVVEGKGRDITSGLTDNESAVIDRVYRDRVAEQAKSGKITEKAKRKIYDEVLSDMERGGIDIDTIEEVLGGETYSNYKKLADAEAQMQSEYDALGKKPNYTMEDSDRRKELADRLKYVREKGAKNEMRKRLDEQVSGMVAGSRLAESFAERSRRGQAFEADLEQYDEKQRAIVQKAVESGILNNTRRTHEFVDMVARIAADRGISFDFTNNAKLKESGFAVEGKTVNGFVTQDGITVNIQSAKSLNSVVGHEITHVLEGTDLYTELQQAVFQYAETKKDLEGRRGTLAALYDGVEGADIDAELTADLVGDYLFTDADFINNLSTNHRNVFQKIYDEVKYLLKMATAGSKEARELEKVKRAFEKAYRAGGKKTGEDGGTQYSLTDSEGRQLSAEQREYFRDSKAVDENGNLKVMYHGTPSGDFTVFRDGGYFTDNRAYAERYQSPSASSISTGKSATAPKVFEVYLDIKKPFDLSDAEARRIYIEEYIKGGNAMGINPYLSDAEYAKIETIDWTEGEDLRDFLIENGYDYDGLVLDEGADGGYGEAVQYRGKSYVVFSAEQVKSVDNANPTTSPDIRYSLSEYSEEEKKAHNAAALEHFGKTYRWAETGYLLLDGTRLDLSGKRFGAPGGYRTVDHRDIADALGADYGDGSYSGALMQFMSEGNIRISPESNGINLSVLPTKAQESSLSAFISSVRGEVLLDIDDYEGDTVLSIEYPKYTHANKVLADIRAWFESGATPEVEGGSVFRRSLSAVGEERYAFGNYNVYGEDVALEGAEDIAPVRQDIATVSKNATVQEAAVYEEPAEEESIYAELDRLTEEAEELERQMYAAMDAGENDRAMEINADLVDAAMRITALEQQLEADVQDRLTSFTDEDAPIVREAPYSESADTVTLPKKMVQEIARDARKALAFSPKKVAKMRELVEKFASSEIDSEALYDEIAYEFRTYTESVRNEDVAEVKKWLRRARINVSDDIKSSFADYTSSIMRPNSRKIIFAKDGAAVDQLYAELTDLFPGFFPSDIIQPADQLQQIIDVANMDITTEGTHEIDGQTLEDVTDDIVRRVNEYRRSQRYAAAEANSRAAFNGLMADADRYAPVVEGDIGPVRADVAPAAPVAEPVQESAPKQIKSVPERLAAELQAIQTELANVRAYREGAAADFDAEIAEQQADYDGKRNKNTKAANEILRRIERIKARKAREDARYAKRISDLEAREAKKAEQVRTGESPEAQGAMREELHARNIEEMRAELAADGYDLDEVLKGAKNLPTFSTVDNTPERVNEKTFGYKAGQIINRLTIDRVRQHITEGTRWLQSITGRNNGLLAQLSKQYHIKPRSKESKAAQMYAEGYFVDGNGDKVAYGDRELAMDFPDAKVQANIKGLARDPRIRQFYDETLAAINASRTRNAYQAIKPLDNYFLHFRAMDDTFSRLGIPFNPNDIKAKDLPTDMNGVTADLKPGQPYFASAKHRRGFDTTFDLLGGLERYAVSAMPQMYLIDDIQMHRAFRNYIANSFGQAHGLDHLDTMTEEEVQERLKEVYGSHLSTYARFLTEEGNVLAGKTALADRFVEGIFGRRALTALDTLNRQVGANMVGFNVSSSLTNFIAPVQAFAKTNKAAFVKGFAQTVANRIGSIAGKGDGFAENNPTMIRRKGADRFYRTPWQKAGDLGYALMGAVDSLSTEIIVRAKYNELVSKGMSHEQAVEMADKWTSRLMGDRSLGLQPQLYNSKMLGLITKFQLEVRNQLDSMFYDTIQEAKVSAEDIQNKQARNAKVAAQVTSTLVQLAVVQHLFGKAFEAVAGYNPAFDIIEAIIKAFGWDDEEDSEDTVLDNLGQGLASIAEDMPYYSVIKDSGRIPISSALPIGQLAKGEDKYGNEKSRLETIAETAPYWLLPGGYGQIKKTTQGLGMFDEDLPIAGSYTDSGNLRYPVEDTFANRAQAALFGQYASANARDYFDNERQALKKNQIQELVDVDMPIREYWDYRDGLKEQETLGDKFDYIAGLDLPIDKKNILINNVVDRKEAVDLTDYDDYADYEEFDFAVKNPEKYDFLQSVGVSVAEYQSFDDDTKDAYNWAYENPDKYQVSRAVSDDVAVYRQYTKALNDITADKDADGKSITGSRKAKVVSYLNNLDADYYTKIILFKMEYNADDTYNREIIEYLNGRNDISYEEEVTILKELGFTVTADGTVRW